MSEFLNCWEFNKCGRESGGNQCEKLGICPAAENIYANSINEGKNGGRICWAIAGTFSGNGVTGTFAKERFSCISCNFFKIVDREMGIEKFELLTPDRLHDYKQGNHKRREYMRFDIYLDLELVSRSERGKYLLGVTRNFSNEGLSFVSENFNGIDHDSVQLRIKHPEKGKFIEASGKIVWKKRVRDRCLAGIKIESIEKNDHSSILSHAYKKWVTTRGV